MAIRVPEPGSRRIKRSACPFCGQKVVNYGSDGSEPGVTPCPHTIFSASDEGFDYRSPEFNAFFRLDEEDDVDVDELGFDLPIDAASPGSPIF